MTNEEIQKHIEQNRRNEHGEPMMDEQAFYEGAKWMRDKALSLGAVVGRSERVWTVDEIIAILETHEDADEHVNWFDKHGR